MFTGEVSGFTISFPSPTSRFWCCLFSTYFFITFVLLFHNSPFFMGLRWRRLTVNEFQCSNNWRGMHKSNLQILLLQNTSLVNCRLTSCKAHAVDDYALAFRPCHEAIRHGLRVLFVQVWNGRRNKLRRRSDGSGGSRAGCEYLWVFPIWIVCFYRFS